MALPGSVKSWGFSILNLAGGSLRHNYASGSSAAETITWPTGSGSANGALINSAGLLTWQPNSAASAALGTTTPGYLLTTNTTHTPGVVTLVSTPIQVTGDVYSASTVAISSPLMIGSGTVASPSTFQVVTPNGTGGAFISILAANAGTPTAQTQTVSIGDNGGATRLYVVPKSSDKFVAPATGVAPDSVLGMVNNVGSNFGVAMAVGLTSLNTPGTVVFRSASGGVTNFGDVAVANLAASSTLAVSGLATLSGGLSVPSGTITFGNTTNFTVGQITVNTGVLMGSGATLTSAVASPISVPNGLTLGGTNTITGTLSVGSLSLTSLTVTGSFTSPSVTDNGSSVTISNPLTLNNLVSGTPGTHSVSQFPTWNTASVIIPVDPLNPSTHVVANNMYGVEINIPYIANGTTSSPGTLSFGFATTTAPVGSTIMNANFNSLQIANTTASYTASAAATSPFTILGTGITTGYVGLRIKAGWCSAVVNGGESVQVNVTIEVTGVPQGTTSVSQVTYCNMQTITHQGLPFPWTAFYLAISTGTLILPNSTISTDVYKAGITWTIHRT